MFLKKKDIRRKIGRRIHVKLMALTRGSVIYPYLYRSYWHYLLHRKSDHDTAQHFYAARPNPWAGIGHQMANWIAGYWFAAQFGLKFAHIPFADERWEALLGFGAGETPLSELKRAGYCLRKLPLFSEGNKAEVLLTQRIMRSYRPEKRIVFLAEQDQPYRQQYGVMEQLQEKFYCNPARANDRLLYDPAELNIALHIRRGDIMGNAALEERRFSGNNYFINLLNILLTTLRTEKTARIYLFSQGTAADFPEFAALPNVRWCLDMNAQDSFLHLAQADILITSKSSFSYKPALLSRRLKICPAAFWHGYPDRPDWILADETGCFDYDKLNNYFNG
jgi:hypothetical protein